MRVVLPFKLIGQKLVKGRDFPKSIADGSKNTIVVKVDGLPESAVTKAYFKLSWENATTYDLTFNGSEVVLDEYIVTLPTHANNKYVDYKISMSIAIFDGNEERLTTDPVELVLNKSNYSDETTNTPEIPQSQYDELAAMTADAKSVATTAGSTAALVNERITNVVLPTLESNSREILDLNDAVFEVVEAEPSSNLYHTDLTEPVLSGHTGYYKDLLVWYGDTIPCTSGDKLYIRLRGEQNEDGTYSVVKPVTPTAGGDRNYNAIRVWYADDTYYVPMCEISRDFTIATYEGKTVVGVDVGLWDATMQAYNATPSDVMVTLNEEPTAFEDYIEGGVKKNSKIEKNEKGITKLQEQIGALTEQTKDVAADVKVLQERLDEDDDTPDIYPNLMADVDALNDAVFDVEVVEPSANLYNPTTANMETGFNASYPNVSSWFCETISCKVGDVIQVGLRGDENKLISTGNGSTNNTNAYRLVASNGAKTEPMPNKSAVYTIPSAPAEIPDIVGVEVGVRDEVLTYNGVGVEDIMVAIGSTRPTTFEEWRASGSVKTSRIEKNEKDIETLKQQVDELEAEIDALPESGGSATDSQVIIEGTTIGDNCAKFAKMLYGTDKAESFIFFTDPHLALPPTVNFEKKFFAHMNILKTYYEATPTNFLMCGGDWLKDISPYQTDDDACFKLGYVSSWMRANFDRYYTAIGNHEDNYQTDKGYGIDGVGGGKGTNVGLSNETIRNLMMPYEKELYYSFDGAQSKFYVLNSSDVEDVDTMNAYRWGQVAWLAQKLKDDNADNSALVIHAGFKRTSSTTWVLAKFSENLLKLCQAYNNATTITLNDTTYDFTDCTGCVRYMLSGHVHDSDTVETHYGIPVITTMQMTRSADSGNGNDPSFDLCLADYDAGIMRMVRVGKYGTDRDVAMATRGE